MESETERLPNDPSTVERSPRCPTTNQIDTNDGDDRIARKTKTKKHDELQSCPPTLAVRYAYGAATNACRVERAPGGALAARKPKTRFKGLEGPSGRSDDQKKVLGRGLEAILGHSRGL
jgi:hypothetical protein